MNLPDEVVTRICKERDTIDFDVAQRLNDAHKVYQTIDGFQKRMIELEKIYKKDIQNLRALIAVEQRNCPHVWKHYPAPSGNNNSCNVCLICNKDK